MQSKSRPGDRPAGLLHVVIYHDDDEPAAAAFTSREMADAFAGLRSGKAPRSDGKAPCCIVEVVVDAHAVGTPPNE